MAESPMVGMLLSGTGPRAQRAEQSTGATARRRGRSEWRPLRAGGRCRANRFNLVFDHVPRKRWRNLRPDRAVELSHWCRLWERERAPAISSRWSATHDAVSTVSQLRAPAGRPSRAARRAAGESYWVGNLPMSSALMRSMRHIIPPVARSLAICTAMSCRPRSMA